MADVSVDPRPGGRLPARAWCLPGPDALLATEAGGGIRGAEMMDLLAKEARRLTEDAKRVLVPQQENTENEDFEKALRFLPRR